ncbi:MAG: chemotaxis protein CheC [Desulfobacteraceae bacterium]|nr:MAG: chemotaxis protein CheC [Desulfobacteraceae bacterium]
MNNIDYDDIFSAEEKEILQEIMNIAFGNATADLAGVVDIYVVLSVPKIQVINIGNLPDYMRTTLKATGKTQIVDQRFWGDFNGSGFLVFPTGAGDDLISLLEDRSMEDLQSKPKDVIEREVLTEIGNILIGACVGKMSELLNTFVTYSPPRVITEKEGECDHLVDQFDPDQPAIVMKTVFKFKQKDVNGFLLILTNQESIGWLRKSLSEFMESYE